LASRVLFEVEDTGIGIPEDQIEMIFDPFRQIDGAHAPKGSAGLGLAISKGLVELMGGEIQVESTPGSGSRFWFELALNALDQQESRPASPLQSIVGFKDVDKKVLIVDDIEDNRAVLVSMLAPLGFELQEARDGLEALDKARRFRPDAILLDVAMPRMDGLEVTRQIRQDPELKETVLIAHSASVYDEERQRTLASGCDAFLSKPVRFERLCLVLETHLQLEPIFADVDSESDLAGEEVNFPPVSPPDDIAAALYEASRRGAIKEIERQISRLQDEDEQYRQTAAYIQMLANEYDFEAINAYLQPIVDARSES
jgi:CheY-like chemotaxis protein